MPIERHEGGTTITGNAINWFQVRTILSAGDMYLKHGISLSRVATPARLRDLCTAYTGKTYPRSRKGLETGLSDLRKLFHGANPDSVQTVKQRTATLTGRGHSGCMIG
jgi:hypothetical protein